MLHHQFSDLSGHFFSTERPAKSSIRGSFAEKLSSLRGKPLAGRAFGPPPAAQPGIAPFRAHMPRLKRERTPDMALEALVHELHNAALLTCVVASWANGFASRTTTAPPQSVEKFLPRDPGVFLTMSRWLKETGISQEALASTDAFFRSLPAARRSFERFKSEVREIGLSRASALNQCIIVDSWRSSSIAGLAALDDLGDDLQAAISERYLQTGRILFALLTSCRNGMSPCLDQTGTPYLPELPQRRRERRFALLENCIVALPAVTRGAFARDISEGGIGLERVGALEVGACVRVHLPIGRTFDGCVVWARNGSAGVKFYESLQPGDPLISN